MSTDQELKSLDDKVLKFLESKKQKPEQPKTEPASIEQEEPELKVKQPKTKQPKTKKEQAKKEPANKPAQIKKELIKSVVSKIKKYKHPLDNKLLSKLNIQKLQQYELFLDEFYNKLAHKTIEQEEPKPEEPKQVYKPPQQLILKQENKEYYYTLYEAAGPFQ